MNNESPEELAAKAIMSLPEETRRELIVAMEARAIAELTPKERAHYDDICNYLDRAYNQDPRTTCIALAQKAPIFLREMKAERRRKQKTSIFNA